MKAMKLIAWQVLISVFLVLSMLTSCTTTPPKTVVQVVERKVEVPRSLLTCTDEPVAGSIWLKERDVARYLVKLAEAGQDCRVKLAAVRRLVEQK
ncbi:hypothetical protein [Neorhizobium tomejilense]|uniref:hypothetical protein n=1 Tax=Neorhizobium tomejilense TaxID=2093828 RepID=UPI003ECC86DD